MRSWCCGIVSIILVSLFSVAGHTQRIDTGTTDILQSVLAPESQVSGPLELYTEPSQVVEPIPPVPVDHSTLLWLASLDRRSLSYLMHSGGSPALAELDGFWYAYNIGRISESFGVAQILKYIDTSSNMPMGRNFLVKQTQGSLLQNGGWEPRLNQAGGFIQDSSFGLAAPSGIGPLGHAVNGVYVGVTMPRSGR